MPTGKLAAMASHLSAHSLIDFFTRYPEQISEFKTLGTSGSRVILKAKNERHILKAYQEALDAGHPCALFHDSMHICPPDFTGEPILVGVGIGPAPKNEISPITRKFNCI